MKRISLVLLLILVLVMTIMPQTGYTRASKIIDSYKISMSALNDGRIQAKAKVTANVDTSKLGFPSILIQEYDGSKWVTVKSISGKYGSGTSYSHTAYYSGTAGKKYRGRLNCSGTFDGETDTRPMKSSSSSVVGK